VALIFIATGSAKFQISAKALNMVVVRAGYGFEKAAVGEPSQASPFAARFTCKRLAVGQPRSLNTHIIFAASTLSRQNTHQLY
jgi:hypothetical protein